MLDVPHAFRWFVLLATTAMLAYASAAGAGSTAVAISEHTLPKAVIRTFHAQCQADALAIIRFDPASPEVCGELQASQPRRVCMPKGSTDPLAVVGKVAEKLCI